MTVMGKLGWLLSLILALCLAAAAYVFVVRGSVTEGDDGRSAIRLTASERIKVLGEMRGMLEAVQTVTEALAREDRAAIENAARSVGMAATQNESPALMGKLPLEFKTLGLAAHKAWDDIADLAAIGATYRDINAALGDILLNCTSCHAGYQFYATVPDP